MELGGKIPDGLAASANGNPPLGNRELAREGLVGLGYELGEAEAMLDRAAASDSAAPEELIAAALRTAAGAR